MRRQGNGARAPLAHMHMRFSCLIAAFPCSHSSPGRAEAEAVVGFNLPVVSRVAHPTLLRPLTASSIRTAQHMHTRRHLSASFPPPPLFRLSLAIHLTRPYHGADGHGADGPRRPRVGYACTQNCRAWLVIVVLPANPAIQGPPGSRALALACPRVVV